MQKTRSRIESQIEKLSEFTATPERGTTRLTYSQEDLKARNYIKSEMAARGLQVKEDGFGNIFGKLEGTIKGAPSVMIGSHFDSVPNGGAFDGPAGVVAGLEVAALFSEYNLKPQYPLEIVALIEEEGSRFGGGLMGSRGIVGLLSDDGFKNLKDKSGVSTEEAMLKIGLDPTLPRKRDPKTMKAFLELHIEQGPILEDHNIPLGVVEAIVGLTQLEVTVTGQAGHAGTTPMNRRADALAAAAAIIAQLPNLAIEEGEDTVITTGRLDVFPNGANVIPDKVVFTVDIRSGKEDRVLNVVGKTKTLVESLKQNGIQTSVEQLLYIQPKELNEEIKSLFRAKSKESNVFFMPINSGAGHDAMVFSDYTDVGMLFIPSKDGLSHCPEEWSSSEHLEQAIQVLFEAAKVLTEAE